MSCSNNEINPCGCKTSTDEINYSGPALVCTGVENCDTLTEALIKINNFICSPAMVQNIVFNIASDENLYNQFVAIVNDSIICSTVLNCIPVIYKAVSCDDGTIEYVSGAPGLVSSIIKDSLEVCYTLEEIVTNHATTITSNFTLYNDCQECNAS